MALCFPPQDQINQFRVSLTEGEAYLLRCLQDNLDDSFEVFVQPFLNGDRPDFVIMRRGFGVIIIEVKDWNLKHYSNPNKNLNSWYLKENNARIKSPLAQVEAYKENLYSLHIEMLFERKITNSKAFAIVQPAVYFHNATNSQLDSFCGEVPYLHLLGRNTINENGINNLIKSARLDRTSYLFDDLLYQGFRRFLNTPHHSPDVGINITYTPRQKILIESSVGTRQKIRGVAGSGKTKVLAGRAVNAYCRTQNTVLVLTFNLTLRNYIHDRISEVRLSFPWSGFEITNYHQFFKQQANNYNLSYDDFFMADDENFFDSVTESIQRYDAILVDEVQDYNQSWLKILVKYFLSSDGEFVVFGDEKQNIYNRKMGEDSFPQIPTILGRWNELKQSFRLDNATLQIAQAFQRQYFVNRYVLDEDVEPRQNNLFDEKGGIIYQSVAGGSIDDLYNLIQTKISELNVHPNDIVILASAYESIRELEYRFRTLKRENTTNAGETKEEFDKNKSMYGEGTKKFKQVLEEIRRGRKLHFWANAGTTKFCTIHSFKGWEADTVILIVSEMQNTDNDICLR